MKAQKGNVLVLAASLLIFISAFRIPVQSEIDKWVPSTDFSFINRVLCISDLFDEEQWTKNTGRSFDSDGIHLTNGKKHPVNSCHYALYCYDEYKRTGDKRLKKAFLDQVSFLRDSTFYNVIDSDMVGYPYNITFHDLKAPWYSALAQSEAICVLIRYYELTRDVTVLPLIHKVMNFMLAPQQQGSGTMSITPEGNVWYEEYPNSKQEKQVLNGFMFTILALHDYSKLFPDNKEAGAKYKDAIKTLKESFQFYNTGSWLMYNRGDKRLVANGYMKWQVLETKMLFEVTDDIFFKNCSMLIGSYCYNKNYETAGSKLEQYNFSLPLGLASNGMLSYQSVLKNYSIPVELEKLNMSLTILTGDQKNMYDSNVNTFTKLEFPDTTRKAQPYLHFDFKKTIPISELTLVYSALDSLGKPEVALHYKEQGDSLKWKKVKFKQSVPDFKSIKYQFNEIHATDFRIVFESMKKGSAMEISNIVMSSYPKLEKSDYWHYITPVYRAYSKQISFDLEHKAMKDVVVFYRTGIDEKSVGKDKWNPLDVYRRFPFTISKDKPLYWQFLIIAEPENQKSTIGKLEFNS